MRYIHLAVAGLYAVYTIVHITQLGIGEWLTIAVAIGGLCITWMVFKKDITGMFLAGMLMGLMVEYITEAYWQYSFKVPIWRGAHIWGDISLYVVLGWGYSFSMFVLFSDWAFKKIMHVPALDKRILLFDAVLAPLWFIPYELLGMQGLHLWQYTSCSEWITIIPILNYPLEGVIGAALFGLVLPSFVRHWEKELRFTQ
jgi:hypothetical protein